jgi:hypothetical protein
VEQVGHAPPSDLKGEGKEGGIGLCKSHLALVLRDMTSRLRLLGCSLRVVGSLLQDVGHIPGDVDRVPREAWHIFFCTVSDFLLPSFLLPDLLLLRGISRIFFSSLAYGGEE